MAKQAKSSENRRPMVDVTAKKRLTVVEISEAIKPEDLIKELEELQAALECIRKKYFFSSAALMRIEQRSFWDLVKAHLYVRQIKRAEFKNFLKTKKD